MAVPDLEKIVKIIFAGEDSQLGQTITSVGGGLDALSGKVGSATKPFANLFDSIVKIDAVLGALAVGALAIATKSAGDFADSFSEISTLIDVPKDKLGAFSEEILDYATDSTQSIEDINRSIYDAISAGEDYTTALALLEQAEKLGIATKADLNTAINLLKPTLNAFGASTSDAADFADILFTTVKTGKTTLDELAPVLANVTGIAATAGVPFSDLAAAIAALTASGVETSQAVTQIKSALTAVLAPTDQAKAAAQELGIAIGQEAIAARGLEGVFKDLVVATGGNVDQLKTLIPRVEGLNAVLVLGKDSAGIFAGALEAMEERAGAAGIAYDKMRQNFELTNQLLINNIQAALIEVGTPLLDEWADLALSIVNILRGIGDENIDWGQVFGPLLDFAENTTAELAGYFNSIAEVLPEALEGIDWTGFVSALESLVNTGKDLLGDLLGGLDLTKAEDLEAAIQKVVDTFTNWVVLTEGLVEGIAPFLNKLVELIGKFSEMDEATVKSIGEFTGLGKAINSIANIVPNLTAPLNLLSGSIGLLSLTQIPSFIAAAGNLTGAIGILVKAFAPLTAIITAFGLANPDEGLGKWLTENSQLFKNFSGAVDEAYLALRGIDTAQIESLETSAKQKQTLAELALTVDKWVDSLNQVPDKTEAEIDLLLGEFFDEVDAAALYLDLFGKTPYEATIDLLLDDFFSDIDAAEKALELQEAELTKKINLDLDEFFGDVDAAEKKLEEVPVETILKIQLQGEIDIELAKIKAQAETLQASFEWQAKVEIAALEAEAEKIVALAELIGTAWTSTGDVISSALGVIADVPTGSPAFNVIERALESELEIRKALLIETQKLTAAQIALLTARQAALERGEGIITITTPGLEPDLEQVLYSIVQRAQIKANEEGFNALLGI